MFRDHFLINKAIELATEFNVVVAAFSSIFLSSHLSYTFVVYVPISEISQNVTLNDRIYIRYVFFLSEEVFLLEQPSPIFPSASTHGILSLTPSLLFICSRTNQRPQPRPKALYIILGPYPYNNNNNNNNNNNRWNGKKLKLKFQIRVPILCHVS